MQYIVRADFYPEGQIVPIGVTDANGNSVFIKSIQKSSRGPDQEYIIICDTNKGLCTLVFKNNRWSVSFD